MNLARVGFHIVVTLDSPSLCMSPRIVFEVNVPTQRLRQHQPRRTADPMVPTTT